MEEKKFWYSKTFWMNLLIPILGYFIPGVSDWFTTHPKEVLAGWSGINILLRFITKGKINIR